MTTLKYGPHYVESDEITPAGIAYLLQYGFAKSLQDSVAGLKKDVIANRARYESDIPDGAAMSDEELAEVVLSDKMAERFADILAGKVGTRVGGQRLDPLARTMRDIAHEAIFAAAAKKGVKRPDGEALRAITEKWLEVNKAKAEEMAKARLAAVASLGEVELD